MNHIDRILYKAEEARTTILALINMSEDELSEMQFLCAYECLERIIGRDEYGKSELPKTAKFWDWWKDQWYRRDRVFLDRLKYDTDLMMYVAKVPQYEFPIVIKNEEAMRSAYKCYHRVEPENNLINSAVLEHGLHRLVRETKQ
jgi:hypothetical protein